MKFLSLTLLTLTALSLGACATMQGTHDGVHRGSVVMKMPNGEAHVCLGDKQVKIGDSIDLIRHDCKTKVARGKDPDVSIVCSPRTLGIGTVTKVYDSHYSVVKFPEDIDFKEGDNVEKPASKK